MVFFLSPSHCLVAFLLLVVSLLVGPVLSQSAIMGADPPYVHQDVHLGLPEHDHRNGCLFGQTNHHHDQGQKESSVLPIEPRWRHYDHLLRDTVLINEDGTWARIGRWVVGQEDWEQTLRFDDGPPSPPMDETATYNIRAHLRSLLTLWSHSKKMRSTGEEREMWQRMLSVESPGIFVGLNRLAPYSVFPESLKLFKFNVD
ncbi:hypothetical protein F5878DRAFT_639971 [Lentinula raphanica]|uniref:Uncharacterized protein n=1 Tax=Lentinula raphanica TaxID=153919 RepID=A0AA38UH36_9AGAR|nr:hypothetical protein F5878DRAFT_639971 [Lentinula raphanica]